MITKILIRLGLAAVCIYYIYAQTTSWMLAVVLAAMTVSMELRDFNMNVTRGVLMRVARNQKQIVDILAKDHGIDLHKQMAVTDDEKLN